MIYDNWEILHILASGGFLAAATDPGGGATRYSLYQFIGGHCYEHLVLTPKAFAAWVSTGAVEHWKNVEDFNGREAALFFLRGTSPLSN